MLKAKTFVKKTKRGNIIKVVREHYLRDDLSCGSLLCGVCPNLSPAKLCVKQNAESSIVPNSHYLVIDTNVALHQVISTAIRLLIAYSCLRVKTLNVFFSFKEVFVILRR